MNLVIRAAGPDDAGLVARFIRELARYEKIEHLLEVDEARLRSQMSDEDPPFSSLLAEVGGEPAGFALFFSSYSTVLTRPCLHLEDIFVSPTHRGRGVGLQLLRAVAAVAVERGCARLDWCVLDWNEKAIAFYERQGARLMTDLRICRLEGAALLRVTQS